MNSFYCDGYFDAILGLKASPPAPYYRSDGTSTDVYAREYLEGYNAAIRIMVSFHEIHNEIKQDIKSGNEQ